MKQLAQLFVWSGTRPRPSIPRITPATMGCVYEDIHFESAFEDAVTLSGWLIKPETPAIGSIVLCHGHTSTRSEMLKRAVLLSKHHFTTLLFDFRARGLSRGDRCTLGLHESWDVIGAVNYLTARHDTQSSPICVIGNSMGGAASICAASRDKRICAVVAEGTFANLRTVVEKRASFAVGPFASRIAAQCAELGVTLANVDIDAISPEAAISDISPRPVLLITDGLDLTCPRSESNALFNAANKPKQRWIASGAPHSMAFQVYPELYEKTVTEFLVRAISHSGVATNASPPLPATQERQGEGRGEGDFA